MLNLIWSALLLLWLGKEPKRLNAFISKTDSVRRHVPAEDVIASIHQCLQKIKQSLEAPEPPHEYQRNQLLQKLWRRSLCESLVSRLKSVLVSPRETGISHLFSIQALSPSFMRVEAVPLNRLWKTKEAAESYLRRLRGRNLNEGGNYGSQQQGFKEVSFA